MQELSDHTRSFSLRGANAGAPMAEASATLGPNGQVASESEPLSPAQIFQILRRRARLIASVVAAGLALAVVYLLITKPSYTAVASIFIDTRQQKVFAADAVLPGLSSDASVIESQVEILRSPNIARRAIEVLGLYRPEEKTITTGTDPKSTDGQRDIHAEAQATAAADLKARSAFVSDFLRNLEVNRIGLTYIISVDYSDPDPLQAVSVANAVADAYIADQTEAKYEATRLANRWLFARIGELRNEVRVGEERVQNYKADHNLIEIDGQNLTEREVAEYTQQLIAGRAKMAEAEAQLQIDQNRARITETSNNAYELAKTKVVLLEKGLEALKLELAQRNQLAIQLAELKRESEATSSLYATLLKRHKETQAQESLQTPDVRIIAYALPPIFPSKPDKKLVLGLASAASLGIGVVLALVLEFSQGILRSPKDLARIPGLPWLASLPVIKDDAQQKPGSSTSGKSNLSGRGAKQKRLWHVLNEESSQFSQAIFSVLHAIDASDLGAQPLLITVVSAEHNDGKTTVAANLAHYAAASGARTLLVDCDLRNPSLTAAMSPNPKLSIDDVISGHAKPAQVIVLDERSGASFCPGPHGKHVARPMNVTGSAQMITFLREMKSVFDIVIVDTPPLRPYVDARALIAQADFVLLVVACGKTKTEQIRTTLRESRLPGDKRVGAILNKVEA
jgi:succinoglycan biosynthesis transport protein ExoP